MISYENPAEWITRQPLQASRLGRWPNFGSGGPGVAPAAPELILDLIVNQTVFRPGDCFRFTARAASLNDVTVDLYAALKWFDNYYFWPSGQSTPSVRQISLHAGEATVFSLFDGDVDDPTPDRVWPMRLKAMVGLAVIAVACRPGTYDTLTPIVVREFGLSGY